MITNIIFDFVLLSGLFVSGYITGRIIHNPVRVKHVHHYHKSSSSTSTSTSSPNV